MILFRMMKIWKNGLGQHQCCLKEKLITRVTFVQSAVMLRGIASFFLVDTAQHVLHVGQGDLIVKFIHVEILLPECFCSQAFLGINTRQINVEFTF